MRSPTSTYRLQISASFDLFEAAHRLAYVHDLGADWVYLSPLLAAERGSTHGYDVISHDHIDPERGGEAGLAALSAEARRLGMGVLVDIVPNHVGVATPEANAWWWDVLEHGRASAYADHFDIDWDFGGGRLRVPGLDGASDEDLNYRRFFAINTLAAVRVEDRRVFEDTHVEIRRWFTEGLVDGLRVDHPDGLREPGRYLDELAELTGGAYVLVEKILEPGESLLPSWATSGTTGYDALALIDRVLTDPAGDTRMPGTPVDWPELTHDTKRAVADGILNPEIRRVAREASSVSRLASLAPQPAEADPTLVEVPRGTSGLETPAAKAPAEPDVVDAVAELAACFPVYRSYLPDGREHLDQAFAAARNHRPDLAATLDELEPVLGDPEHPAALRFQQTTGAVMAKGVEDCAFYRYSRLTSLNEVGGDPSEFAQPVADFHERMARRQAEWPNAMTSLSTHDTKRGEDVRARIAVLAEIPRVWETHLDQLHTLVPVPDPGFGSLLWQAILGAWPASRERLHAYAEKAMREAGDRTTWTAPNASYESAVHAAVDAAFDHASARRVLAELLGHVVAPGWSNALTAKLVSITMPGVPDVYQGSELWEQSLVDPDNRRPVNFGVREDLLGAIRAGAGLRIRGDETDAGALKLLVTHRALTLRRDRPDLFTGYRAVGAEGPAADHVLAFDRGGALTVGTRLPVGLTTRGGWDDTALEFPSGTWRDVLTDRVASAGLAELLDPYPVALLVRDDE